MAQSQSSSILTGLGLSRSERVLGILLFALVVGGFTLGKLDASEAVTVLVALTGVGVAISNGRKTSAETSLAYADAAEKELKARTDLRIELEKKIKELQDASSREIDALKKRLEIREKRVKILEEQNEKLKSRLDEKDEIIKSHQEQLSQFADALMLKDKRIDELEQLTDKQRQEIADLRSEVEELRAGRNAC